MKKPINKTIFPKQNRYAELKSDTWLYRQYVTNHRSMADIAKELGCFENAVKIALKRSGIPVRKYTVSASAIEARKLGGASKRRKTKKGKSK